MATKLHQDPSLYEYLSSDTFWILGIALVANAYWTNRQLEGFEATHKAPNDESPGPDPPTTNASPRRHIRFWLQPHITSRPRQILAVIVYSLVLPLQLLEGSWVLRTAWRLSAATLTATYPRMKPYIMGFVLYLPVTALILAAWAVVLWTGMFLVFAQLMFVIRLHELQPGASVSASPGEGKKEMADDGEWDELGDAESARSGDKDGDTKASEE